MQAEAALVTEVAAAHAAGDRRARELTAEAAAAAAAAAAELADTKAALAAALAPRQAGLRRVMLMFSHCMHTARTDTGR